MNKKTKKLIQAMLFTCVASGMAASSALAQNYPNHPIKLVVPYPAGAAVDNVGRMVASALSEKLDQTIIVENRDGAASQIGSAHVAKAKPDGYTLLLTTLDALTLLPQVKKNLTYDPMADFQDIARIARVPYTIQSNPKLGFKSLGDLVNAAKAAPDSLKYGSTGNGSLAHVAMEMLSNQADIQLIHAPYRGMAASLNDLIAGHIDLAMVSAATIAPYVKTEKVQTLSLASAEKTPCGPRYRQPLTAALPALRQSLSSW
ncbi:tripartite tricarboxylate transporter substrate binding protein [Advenella sp. WQ 585]|uniref:Tripartite tricarboxylate transporter substrate binding protein n=1 Tax=Advenella mandrilli TaxID=2800330 RepID=A0ABS1E921_9BURK|nr:tripartite tricarboxylate transporter substrate binding protein [Advenella mandrilli]